MDLPTASPVQNFDRAGISASLLCAVHCALLPLLLAAIPALGLAWLDSPFVDWSMFGIAACIALWAHRHGFVVHGRCFPAGLALLGLIIIVGTICLLKGTTSQHYIQASGAVIVASSHFLNRRLCRGCVLCQIADGEN
jgi:MerC mercury resistance protein